MAQIKVKLNSAGIREVLQSAEMEADLRRRAKAIAQAAGGEPDFVGDAEVVGDRVMGFVVTATDEGKRAEAETRALTRALDAGR
jgi:hypothetical protein